MTSIRTQVLAQLAKGPRTFEQLLHAITEIENNKQLANCLFALKRAGEVDRDGDRTYRLTKRAAKGAAPPAPSPKANPLRAPLDPQVAGAEQPRANPATAAKNAERAADAVRTLLERNVTDTQSAIDEYVARVADPRILAPLRAARDSAREALAAHEQLQGGAR